MNGIEELYVVCIMVMYIGKVCLIYHRLLEGCYWLMEGWKWLRRTLRVCEGLICVW